MKWAVPSALLGAASQGVDVTPILVALIAAAGSAGMVGWYTRRATNRRIAGEGERFYQEALAVAEKRGQEAVATVDNIRRILEERLTAAEIELTNLRAERAVLEEQIKRLVAERDAAIAEAHREREALQHRIEQLEETVEDLRRQTTGRRRTDRS